MGFTIWNRERPAIIHSSNEVKGYKEPSLELNLGMQNTNDACKLSKVDHKIIGIAPTFTTIPKEHKNFIFYPILE